MDRIDQMKAFINVAEARGFAAAARKLKQSPPAITRAVAALERNLGVPLLTRSTRSVRTTDAGERFLEDAKRILDDLEAAEQAAAGVNANPQGVLKLTAPVIFGQRYVTPVILEYLRMYPNATVDALFLDRTVNLLEEDVELGVRIGTLQDSSMRAKQVGTVRRVTVASPQYLERNGIPNTPQDLQRHTITAPVSGDSGSFTWQYRNGKDKETVRLRPRFAVTNNDAAISAAVAGFGITRVLSYQVAKELNEMSLARVLTDFEPDSLPINIVHRSARQSPIKIRAFIDLFSQHMEDHRFAT